MTSILAQTSEQIQDVVSGIATGHNYTATGVLLLVLLAVGYAVWKVLGWGKVIVQQVLDRGFKHLDKVDETMTSLQASISGIPRRLDDIESKVDGLGNRVDDLDRHITKDRVA